uniref:Phosphatase and actin regulator n=1 Tax=Denticeps clupeoides TaxID=299321 RepID=A0AAY4BVM6_9TELE
VPPRRHSGTRCPAAFHEQRRSLERARTEDYLKRKIRSRPERAELVRMHILEETSAEPSLQAKQLQLKRARLADDLNDKISHRPGPMDLIHKNILPIHSSIKQAIIGTFTSNTSYLFKHLPAPVGGVKGGLECWTPSPACSSGRS